MRNYGENLIYWRKQNNLSQEQLAKEIGITQAAISYWEKNKKCPNIIQCESLADYYGITIDELIGRENIPYKKSVVYNNSTHNGNNNF